MEEDTYNLYDKPLFHDRTAASIYKNIKEAPLDEDELGAENEKQLRALVTKNQKEKESSRSGPVEFEKSGTIKTSLDQEMEVERQRQKVQERRDRSRERERDREQRRYQEDRYDRRERYDRDREGSGRHGGGHSRRGRRD